MIPQSQKGPIYIGTAGWSLPPHLQNRFDPEGSHLTRYSNSLNGVEINSCFYKEHKPETYARWAETVPENFRFSAKLLRYFTQEKRLKEAGTRLKEVIEGMSNLGEKWGVLLVQLPPSLEFQISDAERFLKDLRKVYSGLIAWEPRHLSWATDKALDLLAAYQIHKVLADPEPVYVKRARRQKVEESLVYYRLHGSPEIYKSNYSNEILEKLRKRLLEAQMHNKEAWCIFDNTTFGYATGNALDLTKMLQAN